MKGNFDWENVMSNIEAYMEKMLYTDCEEEKEFLRELIKRAQEEQVKTYSKAA